jgi:hypothetical protein
VRLCIIVFICLSVLESRVPGSTLNVDHGTRNMASDQRLKYGLANSAKKFKMGLSGRLQKIGQIIRKVNTQKLGPFPLNSVRHNAEHF